MPPCDEFNWSLKVKHNNGAQQQFQEENKKRFLINRNRKRGKIPENFHFEKFTQADPSPDGNLQFKQIAKAFATH